MDQTDTLSARTREPGGSRNARRLRREGEVPALLSGLGEEPVAVAVPAHEFDLLQSHGAQLINLDLGDEQVEVLVREVQYDPFGQDVLHIDFDRVQRGQELELEVPLVFFGDPVGVAEGGIFQTRHDSVNVRCLPRAIPENLELDVTELAIGDEVRAKDIVMPEGVALADVDPEETLALISAPVEEEAEEEEAVEEAAAEPEVITAKKEEEEEA